MKFRLTDGERRDHWLKQKKKGKNSFIWRIGILRWAVPMFLIMTVVFQLRDPAMLWFTVLINLVIWPIAGTFYGYWVWSRLEKKYG
jgi:hypothetical protein